MALFDSTAYKPKIVYGASTFQFNDVDSDGTARVSILDIQVTRGRRVSRFEIPNADGTIILGSNKAGLTISITVEISATSLETFVDRRDALFAALEGLNESKFTFYRRYEDANNYACFTNCVCTGISGLDGPHDPIIANTLTTQQGTIDLESEDSDETIVDSGTATSGDTDLVSEGTQSVENAVDFIVQDKFIVQDPFGNIRFKIDATAQTVTIVGTITETL
jgi:hypothetical protein